MPQNSIPNPKPACHPTLVFLGYAGAGQQAVRGSPRRATCLGRVSLGAQAGRPCQGSAATPSYCGGLAACSASAASPCIPCYLILVQDWGLGCAGALPQPPAYLQPSNQQNNLRPLPARPPPAPVSWYGPEILAGLARLRHSAAFTENFSNHCEAQRQNTLSFSRACIRALLVARNKSCKWVALGWVSLQADAQAPTTARFRVAHLQP